jgi:uncharacterized protein YndB with AHSA1/START domain
MSHEFQLVKEIELAGTPDEVWDAIATGPGLDSWFMGRNEIEPGEGGATSMTMAGMTERSKVTGWEPGRRFAHRSEPGEDGAFMAFEYLIEGRGQGSTVLRIAQSGVLSGDWEAEFEAMQAGWDMYLASLAAYVQHFAGRAGLPVAAFRPGAGEPDHAWPVLLEALGIDTLEPGAAVRLTPAGLPAVDGVVEAARLPHWFGIRAADATYWFLHSGTSRGNVIVAGHHLFGDQFEDAQGAEAAWQQWLAAVKFD